MFKNNNIKFLIFATLIEIICYSTFVVGTHILHSESKIVLKVLAIVFILCLIGLFMVVRLYYLYDFKKILKRDFKNGIILSLFVFISPIVFLFWVFSTLH